MGKLNIRLPDEIETKIRAQAIRDNITMSDVIRNALSAYWSGELEAPSRDALEIEIDQLRNDLKECFAEHTNAINELINANEKGTEVIIKHGDNLAYSRCVIEAFARFLDTENYSKIKTDADALFNRLKPKKEG